MDNNMFHQGDLQSGISRAIIENKLVICFVRDSTSEICQTWEREWLGSDASDGSSASSKEEALGLTLVKKAVLLRIDHGTQEAAFLNAFCQIEKIPTVAVIHNGTVLEKLEDGITHEEFRERLLKICGVEEQDLSAPAQQPTPSSSESAIPPPNGTQAQLVERAQRLLAERKKREAADKAERTARANARRKEAEEASSSNKGKQPASASTEDGQKQQARDAWIYQQKQRKDEAKKERERILQQIENDKQERRMQREQQKEMHQAGGAGEFSSVPTKINRGLLSNSSTCALHVRLFDGSSIRSKFTVDKTLAADVRNWIKEASPDGAADVPFTFRQILAPQPNRPIEVSEEHQSLQELGLFPNATLVLVPVAGYSSAYEAANGGYLGSALNAVYWCAGTASSVLGTAASYIPGMNRLYPGDSQEPTNAQSMPNVGNESDGRPDNAKVKTLFDQRSDQDRKNQPATFYNGNSSAFEGNRPDKIDNDNER